MLLFVLLSLAVWRCTALFVYDEGPKAIFVKLRELSDAYGGPLSCFWCTSGWVALLASIIFAPVGQLYWREGLFWWLASWGLAIIVDELLAKMSSDA